MSEKVKNTFLAVLLICLCFMIKCKLDNDKHASSTKVQEDTSVSDAKPAKTNPPKAHEDTKANAASDPQLISEAEPEEKPQEKKIEPPKPKPTKQTAEVKKKAPPKKKTPKKKSTKAKKPKIQFEELVWDFGEITEGDIIKKNFMFTNTGNAPLEIIATSATCGCTRPSFPFLDIAPGESNKIGVTYNSVGKEGMQNPEVTVESNTEPKITIIKLRGTVKPKPKKEETKIDSSKLVKDSTEVKQ